ncbi:MAG TPA: DUF488 domain-containing protein [bacterium]|nr:DUF488 domain-containing protein [bacterium]
MRLYTIGHSTRTLDDLVEALRDVGVRTLVDVRTVPGSRHAPQFNRETLSRTLPRRGIRYRHAAELGGLRRPHADSVNTAWRDASFRGFADYMATPEFDEAILNLRRLARAEGPVALMCAEAVPWRCHRSLIADALVVRRDAVTHIMDPGSSRPHELTPWAKVEGTTITYPGPPPERPSGSRGIAAGRGRRRATQEQLL